MFCLHTCMCTVCMVVSTDQKRASEPLNLMVMNYHVGTKNQTQVLYKSNKCYLSSSLEMFYNILNQTEKMTKTQKLFWVYSSS